MTSEVDAIRLEIQSRLEKGLSTEVMPRADNHQRVREIIARLRSSDGELDVRLVIGGFTLQPVEHGGIEQACVSCMYYLVHKKYCELPELELPVEPEWSCRLWRI